MATAEWSNTHAYLNTDSLAKRAQDNVREHAQRMMNAMELDDLRLVLKAATEMLGELSSPQNPKNYSSLYADVFTHLQQIPYYFMEKVEAGEVTWESLYAMIQHAGFVLPRLYLMVICACGAMKTDVRQVQYYLADLLEYCKGVQQPMRGLFLRSFLNTSVRELLPDGAGDASGAYPDHAATSGSSSKPGSGQASGASVSIAFLLQNFTEMNKLWTRMQRNLPPSEARDTVRTQLAELVGKNLNQLAGLSGLDFAQYEASVLPRVTEQIVSCEDRLAQQYLMECLIMSFPDEFHLRSLELLLQSCVELQPGVEVHRIMSSLMERLAAYVEASDAPVAALQDGTAFQHFLHAAHECAVRHKSMPVRDAIQMFLALMRFVAAVYNNDDAMLNDIMQGCYEALLERGPDTDADGEALLLELLQLPMQGFHMQRVPALDKFPMLMHALSPAKRKIVATAVIEAMAESGSMVSSVEEMRMLNEFVAPLVFDPDDTDLDDEDRELCMASVAQLTRMIDTSDLDTLRGVVETLRNFLWQRAASEALAALPIEALARTFMRALQQHAPALEADALAEHLHFFSSQLVILLEVPKPTAALDLLLQTVELTSQCRGDGAAAVPLLELCLEVYHRSCAMRSHALAGLAAIANALLTIRSLPRDAYLGVAATLERLASSLPVRQDKVRLTLAVANVYWQPGEAGGAVHDEARLCGALETAVDLVRRAEAVYRGDSGSNPATLFLDVRDELLRHESAGRSVGHLLQAVNGELQRLSTTGCSSLGAAMPIPCWDDTMARRLDVR